MVISIINHKGGTGKTTTTVNLGAALAKEKKSVLLVDLDAQSSLSYSLGVNQTDKALSQVLYGECKFKEALVEREGLYIIPSNSALADVEISIANSLDRFGHIKSMLQSAIDYDYVLIDCPPSISLLSTNALAASDFVIIPMQMEVLAVKGLELVLETIEKIRLTLNPNLEVMGVLPIMTDVRKNLYREISEYIVSNYSIPIFQQNIRANIKTAEAPSFGQSVIEYAPNSSSAIDYCAFAKEFLLHVHSLNLNN